VPAQKWENKVIASHVAEFESPPPPPPQVPSATHPAQQQLHFPPMHMMQNHLHYGATQNPYGAIVKSEPVDSRYMLNPGMPYSLPPLPGPNINAARPYAPPTQQRIPQVDGPSDSSGEEDSPPPPSGAFAPRTAHPSLPQPPAPQQQQPTSLDSEAINSDLDDSDTENEDDDEEGPSGDCDIVFCTYDKVTIKKLLLFYRFLSFHPFHLGCPREEQVEVHPQRWYDPCQWKGLSFRKVYRV
jgi:transcription initiation factor TFIIA large subunit